jgi:hypothetical protein
MKGLNFQWVHCAKADQRIVVRPIYRQMRDENGRTSGRFQGAKRPKRTGGSNPLCSSNESLRTLCGAGLEPQRGPAFRVDLRSVRWPACQRPKVMTAYPGDRRFSRLQGGEGRRGMRLPIVDLVQPAVRLKKFHQRRTGALVSRIGRKAARAGIHRRHQHAGIRGSEIYGEMPMGKIVADDPGPYKS